MAVTQISRLQVRRGLQQDLPQLASAELGWSVDTRKLYIGNGTLEEGAPTLGVTEILTENSDLGTLINVYTFAGNSAGYVVQTGSSELNPVVRSYQSKFDDFVNIRDFGAVGDGIVDDTAAINRAIQQIYKSDVVGSNTRARRTIYFPGGTYAITDSIKVPPFARLIGDGVNSTIIKLSQGNKTLVYLTDSKFQTGATLGSNSAIIPNSITIEHLQLWNSNVQTTAPVLDINSASNVKISSVHLQVPVVPSYYSNVVSISSTVGETLNVNFDKTIFIGGGRGISIVGNNVSSISVRNSQFVDMANVAMDLGQSRDFLSINNIFDTASSISKDYATNWVSLADAFSGTAKGLYLSNLQLGVGLSSTITSSPTVLLNINTNSAAELAYEISNGTEKRFGTFSFVADGTTTSFEDNYKETPISINANLFANSNAIICSTTSGSAVIKYSIKQFI